jgi:hypothetical protein
MTFKRTDLMVALRDNFEFWKIVLPILLAGVVAGLAIIEFAFSDHPVVFLGWSITCLISGALLHRWWSRRARDEPRSAGEWS